MPDELSFDALAERGQYRAFQRAYGKENQAMLGLIFLTVAWSYAAHVYGHATVFTFFTRYSILGVLVYLLICGLRYAHAAFEKVAQNYSQLQKEQNDAQREERFREKARERRRRAKEMGELKSGTDSDTAATTTSQAAPAAGQPPFVPAQDAPKVQAAAVPVVLKEQGVSEQNSEVTENQSTDSTQPSTAQEQARHGNRKKSDKRSPAAKGGDQKAAQKTAQPKPPNQKAAQSKPPAVEAAATETPKIPEARNPEVAPPPIPSVSELIASVNELKNNIDIQNAEDRVALAKKQALRAHEQLRAQQVAMHDRERAASVDEAPRNSLKGLLRPAASGQGGYIPPHLREGYTPKTANAQMPRSFEGRPPRPTAAVVKKPSKPFSPAPLARQSGGAAIPIPLPKPTSKESSPATSESSSLRSSPHVSPDQVKEAEKVAFHPAAADQRKELKVKKAPARPAPTKKPADSIQSKNVFMLLPDDDGDSD